MKSSESRVLLQAEHIRKRKDLIHLLCSQVFGHYDETAS